MSKKVEANEELRTPALKTMLNKVGKTPMDEPELYDMIKENGGMVFYDVPKFIVSRAGKEIDDYKPNELALLYRLAVDKITGLKYENGKYKSTKATKELEPLSYEDGVALLDLIRKGAKAVTEDDVKTVEETVKAQRDFVWSVCNLDKNDLTEWEQSLVEAQVVDETLDIGATALDIELGN